MRLATFRAKGPDRVGVVQDGLIFDVSAVAGSVLEVARVPPEYPRPGDVLVSAIDRIGFLRNKVVRMGGPV